MTREEYRDQQIAALNKRVVAIYRKTQENIARSLEEFEQKHKVQDARNRKAVADGRMTEKEYKEWLKGQVFIGKEWRRQRDKVAEKLYEANKESSDRTNDVAVNVYRNSANMTAYKAETGYGKPLGLALIGVAEATRLFSRYRRELNRRRDIAWNRRNIENQARQSILSGGSVITVSREITVNITRRNREATERRIEDFIRGADGAGQMETMRRTSRLGVVVKKQWIATLDAHTRDLHRELDGEVVPIDQPFEIDGYEVMYPKDPGGEPEMIYNCRCTMIEVYEKYPDEAERRENVRNSDGVKEIIPDMTYREWERAHG